MPTRLVREGILASEAVCSLNWAAEVFYRRLMSVVDDYGRFTASPKLIRAACYPLQIDKVSDSDIGKWMAQVAEAGLVRVYPAEDGKRYLQVEKFGQQVRSKSKFPAPPDECSAPDNKCLQPPSNAPVFVSEGECVSDNSPPPPSRGEPSRFEAFWSQWPAHKRKVAKDQCARKWDAKDCDAIADRIMASLKAFKASDDWAKERGEFIPAPLVWLNQARWEADVQAPVAQGSAGVDEAQRWIAQQDAVVSTPEAAQAGVAALKAIRGGRLTA